MRRIYPRYRQASTGEKRCILDEFCANCGYHRKYAIRLLNGPPPGPRPVRTQRRRSVIYGPQLISILKAVWEAADYPWSMRLKALLPEWMPWIRRHFRLTPKLEGQLLGISARSIDYRLRPSKRSRPSPLGSGVTAGPAILPTTQPLKTTAAVLNEQDEAI